MTRPPPTEPIPALPPARTLTLYLGRAWRLRCPECGHAALFKPLRQTRSWHDYVTPLHGCPHCQYAYEREQGYFLIATWVVQYFVIAGFGLALGLIVLHYLGSVGLALLYTTGPTLLLGLAFIRHSKAIYLAVDHYFDPHVKPGRRPRPSGDGAPVG